MGKLLRQTWLEFVQDDCPRLAAAMAFYALLALPSLILLVVAVAGLFAGREAVGDRLAGYFQETMGSTGAEVVKTILERSRQAGGDLQATLIGIAMLVVGATGVMSEMQSALNRAWGVQPNSHGGLLSLLWKRALSLGLVLGIAFLLLISMMASWLLAEFGSLAHRWAPDWLSTWALWLLDGGISVAMITLLFAAILRFLPDVQLAWSDVWIGAAFTALLFVAGKFGISTYLAWNDVTSAYGAAGSLALVLVWLYYSTIIFLFGAELTQVLSQWHGKTVVPEPGATLDNRQQVGVRAAIVRH